MALMVNVSGGWAGRGVTPWAAPHELRVPFSEVGVEPFDDPYHVTRTLKALL